jgi:hypothetical protein
MAWHNHRLRQDAALGLGAPNITGGGTGGLGGIDNATLGISGFSSSVNTSGYQITPSAGPGSGIGSGAGLQQILASLNQLNAAQNASSPPMSKSSRPPAQLQPLRAATSGPR